MKLYNKVIVVISMLLVGCNYFLEESEKKIESIPSDKKLIELMCNNFDSVAFLDYEMSRTRDPKCVDILTCGGFQFSVKANYLNTGNDLIEFVSPPYAVVFCYYYYTDKNGASEYGGIDYITKEKTSLLIPQSPYSGTYQVAVSSAVGAILYDKDNEGNVFRVKEY